MNVLVSSNSAVMKSSDRMSSFPVNWLCVKPMRSTPLVGVLGAGVVLDDSVHGLFSETR